MINAKEISSKRFEKTAFGYKQEDVDDYLRELSLEVAQLQKEKEDCDKKLDVLADKIRDYMKDEDALKDALLGAQRQGHQVIEESKITAEKIISEANEKSDEILSNAKAEIEKEKKVLSNTKKAASDFKKDLLSLYKDHISLINNMPEIVEEEIASAKAAQDEEADIPSEEAEEATV